MPEEKCFCLNKSGCCHSCCAAAPPGEAILARTDATGAGAGVEGAYEAEMMEALAACGD